MPTRKAKSKGRDIDPATWRGGAVAAQRFAEAAAADHADAAVAAAGGAEENLEETEALKGAKSRGAREDKNEGVEEEDEERGENHETMQLAGGEDGRKRRAVGKQEEQQEAAADGEQSEYEVENIVAYRETRKGVGEWRVRWKGFGAADDTWEKRANLEGSPAFWKKMDSLQHKWRMERKKGSGLRPTVKSNRRSTGKAKGRSKEETAECKGETDATEKKEGDNVVGCSVKSDMPAPFQSAVQNATGRSSSSGVTSETGMPAAIAAAGGDQREERSEKRRAAAPVPASVEAAAPPEVEQKRTHDGRKLRAATREPCRKSSNSCRLKRSYRNVTNRYTDNRNTSCSRNSTYSKNSRSRKSSRKCGRHSSAGKGAVAGGAAGKSAAAGRAASASACSRKRGPEPPRKRSRWRRKGSEAGGRSESPFGFSVSSFSFSSTSSEEEERAGGNAERERKPARKRNHQSAAETLCESEQGSEGEENGERNTLGEGEEEEEEDDSECSSGSTTAEDMGDPFDARVYPIIYSCDTEPPTSHLPDEKLLGERLSIYRFRYHKTDARQYLRLRGRRHEETETSSRSEEEEGVEHGEMEECQGRKAHARNRGCDKLDESPGSSRSSRASRSKSSSSGTAGGDDAAEDRGRCDDAEEDEHKSPCSGRRDLSPAAFPRRTEREFSTVLVQYMVDAKYVYSLPFDRMRFYCPQLLLSYLMARTSFKGTRTGKQRRLADLEEADEAQEEAEAAAVNCSVPSPTAESASVDSECEEEYEDQEDMALHPPVERRRAASEPANFAASRKRGNLQESEAEEVGNDGIKVKHQRLVLASDAEELGPCCSDDDQKTEETNNIVCTEVPQQIHRRTEQQPVQDSLDLLDSNDWACAHVTYGSQTCKKPRATAVPAPRATSLGATLRGALGTADATSNGAAAVASRGRGEVLDELREADDVSDDDATAPAPGEHQPAAAGKAAAMRYAMEEGSRRCGVSYTQSDVRAIFKRTPGTAVAAENANVKTPAESDTAQDDVEMTVATAAVEVSAANDNMVGAAGGAPVAWTRSRRGEQAPKGSAVEDAGGGRRTGGKRENSRRQEVAPGGTHSKRGAALFLSGHKASSDVHLVARGGESEDTCTSAVDERQHTGVLSNIETGEYESTNLRCYSNSSRSSKQQGGDLHPQDTVQASVPPATNRTRSQQGARLQAAHPGCKEVKSC